MGRLLSKTVRSAWPSHKPSDPKPAIDFRYVSNADVTSLRKPFLLNSARASRSIDFRESTGSFSTESPAMSAYSRFLPSRNSTNFRSEAICKTRSFGTNTLPRFSNQSLSAPLGSGQEANSAAFTEPMDVPETAETSPANPASCKACHTPTSYAPFAPPPERTSPYRAVARLCAGKSDKYVSNKKRQCLIMLHFGCNYASWRYNKAIFSKQ